MKMMKRLAAVMLCLCLVVPMYSMMAYAANGRVSFTDPDTKTGESVEVTCALRAEGTGLQSFDVTLKYDTEYLAFESGDAGVTKESDGVIKYSGTSNGESRIGFKMKFVALKEGTTKIEVSESKGVSAGGETLTMTDGNSTVKIAKGTKDVVVPTTGAADVPVTVDGVSYNLSDNFKNADIPEGFAEIKIPYEGADRRFVQSADGSFTLGYLVDSAGKGNFFLYNEADSTFSAYVQVVVSADTTIILLKEEEGLEVPKGYQEVKLTVNGNNEFPAWQDTENDGFYLVYAMNNTTGEKGFYQYDSVEKSYQRYVGTEKAEAPKKSAETTNKYLQMLEDNLMLVLIAAAVIFFLLLVLIIVLAVKLSHRNGELDDLYENGIPEEEEYQVEEKVSKAVKKQKKAAKEEDLDDDFRTVDMDEDYEDHRVHDDEEDASDDYDDALGDDFEDDDYDDDYEEDEDDYDDDYDDDFDFDDDDYDVNFIDLD